MERKLMEMPEGTRDEIGLKLLSFMEANMALQDQVAKLMGETQGNVEQINRLIVKYTKAKPTLMVS